MAPLVSYNRRELNEEVRPDGADKRRWGVPMYRVDAALAGEPPRLGPLDAGGRFTMEHHGFVCVEDDIDDLTLYYAQRWVAPIAKLAVAIERGWWRTLKTLWRWGLYEAPHISSVYRHWWQGVSPLPWRGGRRRRNGRS